MSDLKSKFHVFRHVTTRHDTTSTTCRASRDVTFCVVLSRECCAVLVPTWRTTKMQCSGVKRDIMFYYY